MNSLEVITLSYKLSKPLSTFKSPSNRYLGIACNSYLTIRARIVPTLKSTIKEIHYRRTLFKVFKIAHGPVGFWTHIKAVIKAVDIGGKGKR
jgi:hypothetical protein